MLTVEGGDKEARAVRDEWRKRRVEEALMRLRVAHASRALAALEDHAFSADSQRLQLDAVSTQRPHGGSGTRPCIATIIASCDKWSRQRWRYASPRSAAKS